MFEIYRTLLSLLVVLLSSNGARGCMLCFFTPDYRLYVCKQFSSEQYLSCLQLMRDEFGQFSNLEVGAKQKDLLKDIFSAGMFYIERRSTSKTKNFTVDIPDGVRKIKSQIGSLMKAVACIPPCGYQKNARIYKCESCSVVDCGYPLDCELQDIFVNENSRSSFQCTVKFPLPKDVTVLRTRDLSYFTHLHTGEDLAVIIKPTRPYHQGTYSCQIQEEEDILARNYFYINVTASNTAATVKLQELFYGVLDADEDGIILSQRIISISFHELLQQPGFLSRTGVLLIIVAVALLTMIATLLIGMAYRYATDTEERTSPKQ
ncbi:sperm acrosome membrane-associated protein 6 isoform X2 [Rhinatrema bivittatum]|uniref:sperm acrosome membrane-associated protein 6 isoform X2 n=1 Tax=Rhinatrema bivittatum TaxID=194408 RepID=UPI00112BCFEC|nr:sperm acrosome membrane-associated protein 6 isoform X2 [Rhinatrema bivittatum]